jgi:hypothetical protein
MHSPADGHVQHIAINVASARSAILIFLSQNRGLDNTAIMRSYSRPTDAGDQQRPCLKAESSVVPVIHLEKSQTVENHHGSVMTDVEKEQRIISCDDVANQRTPLPM